mmetsp:Transcript_8700/g.11527  ORF Transcript_8700/g.11527 Transcript_8700/m.11527 type:complete len:361 (+) Transcript_8700:186-1268(+)|eukprot:CAMPEP_0198154790 /NCGR_PEP_ID=MMETSP1443-20131203/68789_1 /TAXON_ID=186043 /ORGANISM="Entomoneis sp., Strain CCMP2396" /LENGTH=360 /DNA_ID=CAMNT_0043821501 /DNA_START=176 /DNA_END=1258 /DNA_ORIENTATION=+
MSDFPLMYAAAVDWAQEDVLRPVLILVCASFLFNLPTFIYKVRMVIRGVVYFILCWDKSWKKPQDPGSIFGPHLSQGLPVQRKTVYFVRHGESTWNDTFNKGKHRSAAQFVIGFIPGVAKSLLYETYLLLAGKMDSWFYDSPLSNLGISQAEELAAFLKDKPLDGPEADHIKILRGEPDAPQSKFLSSNLRRAVSTLVVAFKDRLSRRPMDKILVVPCLQEISRNPDTLAITPAQSQIQASWIEKSAKDVANFQQVFDTQLDMSLHIGNKPLDTNGLKRMNEFCEFLYAQPDEYFIVGGHSIWFRSFFQMFLPYSVHHASKEKKIVNGGVVTFELMKAETRRGPRYMVDPKTIQVVYGGF